MILTDCMTNNDMKRNAIKKSQNNQNLKKNQKLPLPSALYGVDSIDLTRHRIGGKLLTQAESLAIGKAQRKRTPRSRLAKLATRPAGVDALTLYHWSNQGRLDYLLTVRAKRMSVSPFTFFRGMPALMLFDQVWETAAYGNSGLYQQICGDCHLSNFGGFASPERNLLFGLNDFDETLLAPFEWDLKRLVSSIMIAATTPTIERAAHGEAVGLQAIERLLNSYRSRLAQHQALSPMQVWYEKVDASQLLATTESVSVRTKRKAELEKAKSNNTAKLLPKLTTQDARTGLRQFKDEPPIQQHPKRGQPFSQGVSQFFAEYRDSLKFDRQVLFDRYQLSDVALKVVGVGSVGNTAAVAIFEDADHEPLMLQMKQAKPSVLAPLIPKSMHLSNQGARVMRGQQLMQAASDIFLGYGSLAKPVKQDFYVRQLRDMKYSADIEAMDSIHFFEYVESCGLALAHAHAKAGNADAILSYLGGGLPIVRALQSYALAAAARNLQDFQQFNQAIVEGLIEVADASVL